MPIPSDLLDDLQAGAPSVALGIDDVGVRGIVRGIVLRGTPTTARIDVGCGLHAGVRGAHMSRFHESIDQALSLVGDDGADVASIEVLTAVIAGRALDLQDVTSANATVRATVAQPRVAPASGRRTIDPFDVWASVRLMRDDAGAVHSRTTLGVSAVGMTACPCAQNLVRSATVDRLRAAGNDDEAIAELLPHLPIATHNQRSTGVLELTVPGDGAVDEIANPLDLVDLVRASMSASIYELLKRDDELAVVEAAHADPRFVEDCVRALLADTASSEQLAQLPDATEILVRQINHESIHAHDVEASRRSTLGTIRLELDPDRAPEPA
jgi:MptA/FolE2 family GTP cyclohydrolase